MTETKNDKIKKKIRNKHRTLSAFARVAGIDRYELQKMFTRELRPNEEKQILTALETLSPEDLNIPTEKLELLKSKIEEAGGIYKFCKDNPEFEKRHVYQVCNGEFSIKSRTYKALLKFFNIE